MGWFLRKRALIKKALRKRFKTNNRNKTHDDQPQARPVKKMGWFVEKGASIKNAWRKRIQTKNRNKTDDDQSQARPGKAERKSIQNRTDDDQSREKEHPQARPFSFGKVVAEFTDMLKGSQGKVVNKEGAKDAKQSTSKKAGGGSNSPSRVGITDDIKLRMFMFPELFMATENFMEELGRGGFGKVYKGCLLETDETVAVKRLDRNGSQGIREFFVEIFTLRKADHPNLVKLIGFCAVKDQRMLVYEYVPLGSLDNHLHDLRPNGKCLDWNTRMKIAADVARGLEYLHNKMKPPVIYRDMKCSNILLGEGYNAKLSDFGFAKVGPIGDETHVSTRLMGTYGYCAPEYAMTGQLTLKSDIYNFGVVLLEIITGRKAIDSLERSLVSWARPLLKGRKKFRQLADPALAHQYPVRGLYQSIAIAALCVHEQPNARPVIADVVRALDYLASQKYEPKTAHSSHKNSSTPIPKVNLEVTKKRHRLKVRGNGRTYPVKSHTNKSCPVIIFGATHDNSFSPKSSRAYMSA